MNRDEILGRVADAMTELFDIERERVRLDARLRDDLDLDSLDAVDLAVELQRISGRRLDDKDLRRIRTVGDIVEVVARDLAHPR